MTDYRWPVTAPIIFSGVTQSNYTPAWWLPGRHLRTLWGKFFRRVDPVATRRERWDTPDGDFVDVVRLDAPPDRPRVLLLHGLEGAPWSHYARGTLAEARRRGWGVDLLVFRTCGGELKRFAQKFGVGALIDPGSRRYQELGLQHARYSDERWLERLVEEPLLLRVPLVRQQQRLTVGLAEAEWKNWLETR